MAFSDTLVDVYCQYMERRNDIEIKPIFILTFGARYANLYCRVLRVKPKGELIPLISGSLSKHGDLTIRMSSPVWWELNKYRHAQFVGEVSKEDF